MSPYCPLPSLNACGVTSAASTRKLSRPRASDLHPCLPNTGGRQPLSRKQASPRANATTITSVHKWQQHRQQRKKPDERTCRCILASPAARYTPALAAKYYQYTMEEQDYHTGRRSSTPSSQPLHLQKSLSPCRKLHSCSESSAISVYSASSTEILPDFPPGLVTLATPGHSLATGSYTKETQNKPRPTIEISVDDAVKGISNSAAALHPDNQQPAKPRADSMALGLAQIPLYIPPPLTLSSSSP